MVDDASASAQSSRPQPIIIAHRGASGYRPEHTLEGYLLAIEMGADFIEPDLVSTKDGHLVARHEPNITETTDVQRHPEFASRWTTKVIDGVEQSGWFASDFTLAELRTLRTIQPRPYRSPEFDGQFLVPTLEDIIDLAKRETKARGRTIGIYPETKHPTWHGEQGLLMELTLLDVLAQAGWTERTSPVFIQCFEAGNLKWLRERTGVRLIQLVGGDSLTPDGGVVPDKPWHAQGTCKLFPAEQPPLDFGSQATFNEIARYADGIGPWKRLIVGTRETVAGDQSEDTRHTVAPTGFVAMAHEAGLDVHPWTFRNESMHLAIDYAGDPMAEYQQFFALGVDGVFSDFSDTAVAARTRFLAGAPPAV